MTQSMSAHSAHVNASACALQWANGSFVKLRGRTFVVNYTLYTRIERKRGTHLCGTIRRCGDEKGGRVRGTERIREVGVRYGKRMERRARKSERGNAAGGGGARGGWFQLGGSNSPGHCSFHSRFVFPVCLFPSHLR